MTRFLDGIVQKTVPSCSAAMPAGASKGISVASSAGGSLSRRGRDARRATPSGVTSRPYWLKPGQLLPVLRYRKLAPSAANMIYPSTPSQTTVQAPKTLLGSGPNSLSGSGKPIGRLLATGVKRTINTSTVKLVARSSVIVRSPSQKKRVEGCPTGWYRVDKGLEPAMRAV